MKRNFVNHLLHPTIAARIILRKWLGISISTWTINFIFQRILRQNGDIAFQVHFTSKVLGTGQIKLGRNVWKSFALSGGCYVQSGNGIIIGDDTIFGPGVKIISANHDSNNHMTWKIGPPIKIGSRCWIGANAVILPGVELGDDCIVGAGAVVTKHFTHQSVLVGIPARSVRKQIS